LFQNQLIAGAFLKSVFRRSKIKVKGGGSSLNCRRLCALSQGQFAVAQVFDFIAGFGGALELKFRGGLAHLPPQTL
jgi:hypothetical protein